MKPFDNNSTFIRDSRQAYHHRFQVEGTKIDLVWALGLAIFAALVAGYISSSI